MGRGSKPGVFDLVSYVLLQIVSLVLIFITLPGVGVEFLLFIIGCLWLALPRFCIFYTFYWHVQNWI